MKKKKSNFCHSALLHMKTRVSLKYFVNDFLWEQFLAFKSPPNSFKLNFFDNFANSKAFHTILV